MYDKVSLKYFYKLFRQVTRKVIGTEALKGQYHGRSIGDIMIFGQNSLNLKFEHCVN